LIRTTILLMILAAPAFAGPFGLFSRRGGSGGSTTTGGGQVDGELASAQGVADRIARTGIFRHWGGNPGYEGIGMGVTPEAARRSCCYANRFAPVDIGYAQMANGMWVCCQRY